MGNFKLAILVFFIMIIPLTARAQSTDQNNSTNQSQTQPTQFGYNPVPPSVIPNGTNNTANLTNQPSGVQSIPTLPTGMLPRAMVATSDGGVVIVVGDTLLKYDQDLKPVSQTQIKIDPTTNSTSQ